MEIGMMIVFLTLDLSGDQSGCGSDCQLPEFCQRRSFYSNLGVVADGIFFGGIPYRDPSAAEDVSVEEGHGVGR